MNSLNECRQIERENSPFLLRKRIYTLADMQIYAARRLVNILNDLFHVRMWSIHREDFTEEIRTQDIEALTRIESESVALGLQNTSILARRISGEIKTADHETAFARFGVLEERFWDDLRLIRFLFIKPELFRFFETENPAGEQLKENFPRANVELIDAGKCLALDRYTASVFHLMRAFEIVLVSLEGELGISRPKYGPEKTWGRTLKRIGDKIAENDKTSPPGWSTEKGFYVKAHAFLSAVKTPLRDDTMHVETNYDEASAVSVFNVSVEALRFLATGLR